MRAAILPAVALITLSACSAAGGRWPSLERRPAERANGLAADETAVTPAPIAPPRDLTQQRAALARAQAQWAEQKAAVDRALGEAHGAAPESPRWAEAEAQLSRLEDIALSFTKTAAAAREADDAALLAEAQAAIGRHDAALLAARTVLAR